ncbi:acyltransferase [Streptomyces sp. PKU-MA01144]|uniref:acyltransferase family protein n=1 Tax=Streptomyces TaxID=1883 RepID=UPI00147ACA9D|nr:MULTISPECIES: acyltransferase [Streptomyces]MCY0980072.1 acyltransferase [Streptomyces tirandamycinicus]NNJ03995.1 acyltransferase [Streptomyces sp. PKU-MA01144]
MTTGTTGTTPFGATRQSGNPAPEAPAPERGGGRDLYFDLLRALALFRVVLYHLVGWAWLPLLFPSMGVMFALAGNLMARSLKRPAVQVIRGRMRRLLPPLWVLGAVGVTGMVLQGWGPDAEGYPGWWWFHLLYWIVPLSDPPYAAELAGIPGILGESWAENLAGPLWYLRAYLWYVMLSPLLLWALRRVPWLTLVAPLALSGLIASGNMLWISDRTNSAITDFSTFGACWVLGMAHQEGVLRRLPRYIVPSVAPVIMAVGLWWALREGFRTGYDLDSIPFAQAVWSFGAVLLLLHISPSWREWPPRLRAWADTITLLNSRAVTVYLWHNVCILAAATMWNQLWGFEIMWKHLPWLMESWVPVLIFTWALIAACIVLFGWAEDVAAKRRPRLWPNGATRREAAADGAGPGRTRSHRA